MCRRIGEGNVCECVGFVSILLILYGVLCILVVIFEVNIEFGGSYFDGLYIVKSYIGTYVVDIYSSGLLGV